MCNMRSIYSVFPDYDPAQDWIGISVGDGTFADDFQCSSYRIGDVIPSSGGGKYTARYVDHDTLVTRQVKV